MAPVEKPAATSLGRPIQMRSTTPFGLRSGFLIGKAVNRPLRLCGDARVPTRGILRDARQVIGRDAIAFLEVGGNFSFG
jgi:hypothetical protein